MIIDLWTGVVFDFGTIKLIFNHMAIQPTTYQLRCVTWATILRYQCNLNRPQSLLVKHLLQKYPYDNINTVGCMSIIYWDQHSAYNWVFFAGDLYTEAAEEAMAAMKGRMANKYYALAEEAYAAVDEE